MNQSDYTQPIYPSQASVQRERSRDRRKPKNQFESRTRKLNHDPDYHDSRFESPDTFMNAAEIRSLTGRSRARAQAKALRSMGIEHKVRPDGRVAVLRAHIDKVFDGGPGANSQRKQVEASPNWLAI